MRTLAGLTAAAVALILVGCSTDEATIITADPAPTESPAPQPAPTDPDPTDEEDPTDEQSSAPSPDPADAAPTDTEPTDAEPTDAEPPGGPYSEGMSSDSIRISPRGLVIKDVGEWAALGTSEGDTLFEFRVTDIVTDFQCTGPNASEPENLHYVAFRIEIEGFAALDETPHGEGFVRVMGYRPGTYDEGSTIGILHADGERSEITNGLVFDCLADGEQVSELIAAEDRSEGWVVLDTEVESGYITFEPEGLDTRAGWEYQF